MTREEQIDWLCRLRADLNNGVIFTPWNKEFTEALNDVLEQEPTTKNLAADREDAVERLNAIKQLIGYDKDSEIVKVTQKSLDMAIKALEQESVIDKIRAEIEKLSTTTCTETRRIYIDADDFKENVLAILDKYKADRNDKE